LDFSNNFFAPSRKHDVYDHIPDAAVLLRVDTVMKFVLGVGYSLALGMTDGLDAVKDLLRTVTRHRVSHHI
jgi:hypothetical protein